MLGLRLHPARFMRDQLMPSITHTGPGMAHAQQSAGCDRERNAEAEFRWAEDIIACSTMSIRDLKEAVLKGLDDATLCAALEAQFGYPGHARPVPI